MKLRGSIFVAIFLLLIRGAGWAHDYEWPVESPRIIGLIGMKKTVDNFETGLVFENTEAVRTTHAGTLLVTLDSRYRRRNFPSALGNTAIFIDETGLQSVYGNLSASEHLLRRLQSDAGSTIARSADSAWEQQKALPFQMIDTKKHVFLNPQFLLPSVNDTVLPEIASIALKSADGKLFYLRERQTIPQGDYELYALILDYHTNNKQALNPFSIALELNGITTTEVSFEVIKAIRGDLYIGNTDLNIDRLYDSAGRIYLGKVSLVRGSLSIVISVHDISGNHRKVIIENTVR